MAGRISRCMIVLDALNQLDSGTGSEGNYGNRGGGFLSQGLQGVAKL